MGDHTGQWHRGDLVVLRHRGRAHRALAGPHLRRLPASAGAPGPAADAADAAVRREADDLGGGRGLAALLPGLRAARPGPAAPSGGGRPARAQLLLVQRADGGLTIGDTHEYDEPFPFDVDEAAYDHLRGRAEGLLGAALPPAQRRWAGVYSEVDPAVAGHALYHRSEVEPGVVLVTGPGGRGMTCSPAIAEETFC